jgi:hypothetical protein
MKQITKTPEILAQLRKAYGPDAALENLGVWEVVLANTVPLRKSGGLFKNARLAQSVLIEVAAAVNDESVPIQAQHKTDVLPIGRLFSATVLGSEARGLIAVSTVSAPLICEQLDNGTIDQVSLGMLNKHLLCSECGFDYQSPQASEFRWDLTCDKDHRIGEKGVHVQISGLDSLFECSLVGQGAVKGARVLGPSESVFQDNARLAASVRDGRSDVLAIQLSPTPEENMNIEDFTTQLTAAVTGRTTAEAQVTSLTTERDAATAQVATLTTNLGAATAQVTSLTSERDTALASVTALTAERDTAAAQVTAAVTALKAEATKILTACGKAAEIAALTDDVPALLAVIDTNRAAFAAVIPVNGASSGADSTVKTAASSNGAFRSPARA